jgi:ribosomal protein S27AE
MSERLGSKPPTIAPPLSIPEGATTPTGTTLQWHCSRCGSTDLASGYMIDYSDKFRQLQLAPKALKLKKLTGMLRPFHNLVKVNAQVCRRCGAVTLEVNPEDFAEAERRYGRR